MKTLRGIEQGILKDFLIMNKAEVISMCIFECDMEEVMELWKEEASEIGYAKGHAKGLGIGEIRGAIKVSREFGKTDEEIVVFLKKNYTLRDEEIQEYLQNV